MLIEKIKNNNILNNNFTLYKLLDMTIDSKVAPNIRFENIKGFNSDFTLDDSIMLNGIYKSGILFDLDDYDNAENYRHTFKFSSIKNYPVVSSSFCKLFIQEKKTI